MPTPSRVLEGLSVVSEPDDKVIVKGDCCPDFESWTGSHRKLALVVGWVLPDTHFIDFSNLLPIAGDSLRRFVDLSFANNDIFPGPPFLSFDVFKSFLYILGIKVVLGRFQQVLYFGRELGVVRMNVMQVTWRCSTCHLKSSGVA